MAKTKTVGWLSVPTSQSNLTESAMRRKQKLGVSPWLRKNLCRIYSLVAAVSTCINQRVETRERNAIDPEMWKVLSSPAAPRSIPSSGPNRAVRCDPGDGHLAARNASMPLMSWPGSGLLFMPPIISELLMIHCRRLALRFRSAYFAPLQPCRM